MCAQNVELAKKFILVFLTEKPKQSFWSVVLQRLRHNWVMVSRGSLYRKKSWSHFWQFPSKHCPGEKGTKPTDFQYIDSFVDKPIPILRWIHQLSESTAIKILDSSNFFVLIPRLLNNLLIIICLFHVCAYKDKMCCSYELQVF